MKRVTVSVFACIAVAAVCAVPAWGADVAKIGIVDFQRILTESEAGKDIQAKLQKKGREMESDIRGLGTEIEKLREQLDRESMVMSRKKREEKQRELDIKKYDFQSKQKKYQSELRELETKLLEKLQTEIFSLAEEIGKQEGYLLIIEKSAAIYYPNSIDITDKLIEKYNATYSDS
ncbi:MAG TPA: OmpH family outer membrane protein [Desulfosalsimonadaceae bacterium]|nr:OmpH family outer membrane protein [Desulfosalsimonadaceae bacterium]